MLHECGLQKPNKMAKNSMAVFIVGETYADHIGDTGYFAERSRVV